MSYSLSQVSWRRFQDRLELAQAADAKIHNNTGLFLHDSGPFVRSIYTLSHDGMSGFAITYDDQTGRDTLKYVFSRVRGRGDDLVRAAKNRGATHLDRFEPLVGFYERHGFVVEHMEPNYYPPGPNVAYMQIP